MSPRLVFKDLLVFSAPSQLDKEQLAEVMLVGKRIALRESVSSITILIIKGICSPIIKLLCSLGLLLDSSVLVEAQKKAIDARDTHFHL